MADFDIKEIASLKRQLRIIEKLTLAGWDTHHCGFLLWLGHSSRHHAGRADRSLVY